MEKLKVLMKQLIAGEIEGIEYGEPGKPFGFMSSHRIILIPTAGGIQLCIKKVYSSRGLGSGMYFGLDSDSTIQKSEQMVQRYLEPHPIPVIREMLAKKGDRTKLEYFSI